MSAQNITFVIFTYNEEKRIERVIRNVYKFGRVLLADNKSTDRTLEIAAKYGCAILTRENNYVFLENQELASLIYNTVTTDWIFWMYADEMLEKATLEEINRIVALGKYDMIDVARKNYLYGDFTNELYISSNQRVFKKWTNDFTNNPIHGMGRPTVSADKIYKLPTKYFIHQFMDYTASNYLGKTDKYTEVELDYHNVPHKTVWYFILRLAKNLVKNYFFEGGYKLGFPGLAITELSLIYELVKNIKVYERANSITVPVIEGKNNIHRDAILKEIEQDIKVNN
jgi:glycosyltransferase involved in cell wall biosynthesis